MGCREECILKKIFHSDLDECVSKVILAEGRNASVKYSNALSIVNLAVVRDSRIEMHWEG